MPFREATPEELAQLEGAAMPARRLREATPEEILALEAQPTRPSELNGRMTPQERALAVEPDEPPAARAAPGEPRTPDGVPALRDPKAPGQLETGLTHGAHGLTGGFADELGALVGRIPIQGTSTVMGMPVPQLQPEDVYNKGAHIPTTEEYRHDRDLLRQDLEDSRKENPGTALAGEVGGAVLSPLNKLGPVARAGAGILPKVGAAAARGAVQGAVYGAGGSNADLTTLDAEKAKEFAKDVAIGGAVGGAVGAAGEGAAQGVRAGVNAVKKDLTRALMNEIAEGSTGATTTATGRKRLEGAAEDIAKEVVEGPDGKTVRAAWSGDAAKGREAIKPLLEKVRGQSDAAYGAFAKAGKSKVDADLYGLLLLDAAEKADKAGQSRVAEAIRTVQRNAEALSARTGGLDLQQLRGFTTEVQGQASSVLGSLNEHANAKAALQVQAVATKAMDDTLSMAAAGDKALTDAANTIRGNNQRFHALLTIDDSLRMRAYKEATGESNLVRGAKLASKAITGGAAGAVIGGEDERLRGAAIGAGAGLLVPAVRAAQRGVTSLAIKGAQGGLPGLAATEAATGAAARGVARAAVGQERHEDPTIDLFRLAKTPGNEERVMKKAAEIGLTEEQARNIIRAMQLTHDVRGQR